MACRSLRDAGSGAAMLLCGPPRAGSGPAVLEPYVTELVKFLSIFRCSNVILYKQLKRNSQIVRVICVWLKVVLLILSFLLASVVNRR